MKNIRIWFKKVGAAKYISHLDLCRCMERAIHKAKLPFWYTEGFNPHIFLTINMPISLGYTGLRECMDVKLLDEGMDFGEIIEKLNGGLPGDIQVFEITQPVMAPSAVAFSAYEVTLPRDDGLTDKILALLSQEVVTVMKRSKKGEKPVDIKPYFKDMCITQEDDGKILCKMVLPSSNAGSINPRLFFELLEQAAGRALYPQTVRTDCFDEKMQSFA